MYTKINRVQARKLFNARKNFILVPCNCGPASMFALHMTAMSFEHLVGYDFDRAVMAFEYYNCNAEAGKKVSYYIED